MQQLFVILSPVGFFRFIGILVVFYFALKFIGRLLFPIVVKKAVNNMQARQSNYRTERKPEGEVTIEKKPGQQGRHHSNEGEYVDFEEVE